MAEAVIKPSQSAEDVEKPGKISHELLHKFESDPSLARPQSLPVEHFRMSAQSFTSSSDETATSHENLKERKMHVRIKVQDTSEEHLSPSSAEEEMLSDEEAGNEKKKKKRKLRWKWSPFKKVRRLFKRRKSPTRVKSCEELPTGCYNSICVPSDVEHSDPLTNRAKSESSLVETKTKTSHAATEIRERRNPIGNPIYRTKSDSCEVVGNLLEGLEHVEDKSQEDISEDPTMTSNERESQAGSTVLDWSMRSSDSGAETAVSFDDLPSTSSLEGLQAAHDRIKVAPKHRRPPTRPRSNSSSNNLPKSSKEKPHRRSKTDPKDFTVKPHVESTTSSDVSVTIFESQEVNEEQSKEKIIADLKAKAEDIITKSSQTSTEMLVNSTDEKKGSQLKDGEKNKPDCGKDGSADSELKSLNDNTDKENQTDCQKSLLHENAEEEIKSEDKVLKELNNKNEEHRLVLKKRSESLDVIEVNGKLGSEIGLHNEAESIPPKKGGFSLNSFESKEKSSVRDFKVRKQLESEKLVETSVCKESQSANTQTNNAGINQTEPKVSVSTGSDEKKSPDAKACDKETSSVQNEGYKPVLKKRSESLDVVEMKGKLGRELGSHTGAASKPQVRRGFSLNTLESTEKNFNVKKLMEKEKLGETSVCKENQSANTQTNNACINQTETKVFTSTGLNENNSPCSKACDKETGSVQPSWVELANQRSKRLSQLLNEGVKEDSQALSKVVSAASNVDKKPIPRQVKEKPAVPAKKDGLSNKAKKPKPDPSSKTFYGKVENNKGPTSNSSSQGKLNLDKRTGLPSVGLVTAATDKCVVCGTAVYQMEKCSLDHWVLHRRCVKCTVCKRLLTVGNFVMAECKVYCKPHAKAVTVSM